MSDVVIGIDIGGTNLRAGAVVDGRVARVLTRPSTLEVSDGGDPAGVIIALVAELSAPHAVAAVGIAATGPVNRRQRRIDNPFNLPDWSGSDWVRDLERRLSVPVVLENDAMGAALGEFHHGAGRGSDVTAMVTLGTGVGVAVVSRTAGALRGALGAHPEAGHVPIRTEGTRCYCGTVGCWETYSNGAAVQKYWRRSDGAVDWVGYGEVLARGITTVVRAYGPDRVVIGGGIAANFADFAPTLHAVFAQPDPMGSPTGTRIVVAELAHPAILGAAALAATAARARTPLSLT